MPTGYTSPIYEGQDISFEQFVLRCSRGMGAAITQRDESLDVEIEYRTVADYYFTRIEEARSALDEAFKMTDEEWDARQREEITKAATYRVEYVLKRDAMDRRYQSMLAQVRAWEPPSSDHDGLREFMIQQLEGSIRFDCGNYTPDVPNRIPVSEYKSRQIARLSENLSRESKYLAEEQERVAGQNAWVRTLRDSLAATQA